MENMEKAKLENEVYLQKKALKTIDLWKNLCVGVSTLGVAMNFASVAGVHQSIILRIISIFFMVIGLICALVCNLALKNGRRNVEKMMNVLQ